jgi:hypothetical protein
MYASATSNLWILKLYLHFPDAYGNQLLWWIMHDHYRGKIQVIAPHRVRVAIESVLETLSSILDRDTGHTDGLSFRGFPQALQKCRDSISIWLRSLPSKSFPIYHISTPYNQT